MDKKRKYLNARKKQREVFLKGTAQDLEKATKAHNKALKAYLKSK